MCSIMPQQQHHVHSHRPARVEVGVDSRLDAPFEYLSEYPDVTEGIDHGDFNRRSSIIVNTVTMRGAEEPQNDAPQPSDDFHRGIT